MSSGSHVQLAALWNRDLELQTTSPFSNHGSVERSTACCRHKTLLDFFNFYWAFQKFPFFVTLYYFFNKVLYISVVYNAWFRLIELIKYIYWLILRFRKRGWDSSVGTESRYGPDGPGIKSGGGEIFRTRPDRPWSPSSLRYNRFRVLPDGKAPGAWRWPPTRI
jgi:hypothetical protein